MINVVSGSGLGLFDSQLVSSGSSAGQSGEQIAVNAATGNLILQAQDESLLGQNQSLPLLRTYNSQGQFDGDPKQRFRFSVNRQVLNLQGPINTDGSTIERLAEDGHLATFYWQADRGQYLSTDGDGAHDSLRFDSVNQTWTYIEGSTQTRDVYQWDGTHGRLQRSENAQGQGIDYHYDGDKVVEMADDLGNAIQIIYDDNGQAQRITSLVDGQVYQAVSYHYELVNGASRLTGVDVDLTPESAKDAVFYSTTYGYDGDSQRINQITQSDGTQIQLTYTQVDGDYRVAHITQGAGDAQTHTRITYGTATSATTGLTLKTTTFTQVSELATQTGPSTVYYFDDKDRLVKTQLPASDQRMSETHYQYDDEDNLTQVTNAEGLITTYQYQNGVVTEQNDAGRITQWQYNAHNQVISSTTVLDDSSAVAATRKLTTHYFYDEQKRLRFVVDAAGHVQETRYQDSYSSDQILLKQTVSTITFLESTFDVNDSTTTAELVTWVDTTADRQQAQRVDIETDFTQRIVQSRRYSIMQTDGTGDLSYGLNESHFVYDPWGNLIKTIERDTDNSEEATDRRTTLYTYDGLDRLTFTQDALGVQQSWQYLDAQRQVKTTLANGSINITLYDQQGRIASQNHYASNELSANELVDSTHYHYDVQGRLRRTTDFSGAVQHYQYDERDQLIGLVDKAGVYTEMAYDALGRLIRETVYHTAVSSNRLHTLRNDPTALLSLTDKPAATDNDRSQYYFYNDQGESYLQVDSAGAITHSLFSQDGLVTEIREYAPMLNLPANGLLSEDEVVHFIAQGDVLTGDTRRSYFIYDDKRRLVATVDAENAITEYRYDGADQLIQRISYANPIMQADIDARLSGNEFLAVYRPKPSDDDVHWNARYDAQGQRVAELDGEGYLTITIYDEFGNLWLSYRYVDHAHRITGELRAAGTVQQWLDNAGEEGRLSFSQYNLRHELIQHTDAQGVETRYSYTDGGLLASEARYRAGSVEHQTNYTYDALDRLSDETSSGHDGFQSRVSYQYNKQGQVISMTDANGAVSWNLYNRRGELTHQLTWFESSEPSFDPANRFHANLQSFTYNAFGELTGQSQYTSQIGLADLSAVLTTNGAETVAFSHPDQLNADNYVQIQQQLNHLLASSNLSQQTSSIAYDNRGNVKQTIDGEGYAQHFTYDRFNDLTQVASQTDRAGTAWAYESYQYNRRGQVLEQKQYLTHQRRANLALDNLTANNDYIQQVNTYNALGQLTGSETGNDAVSRSEVMTYDKNGQLIHTLVDPDGLALFTEYFYNGDGQITQVNRGGKSQTYNPDTRAIELSESRVLSTTIYQYNDKGQLVSEGKVAATAERITDNRINLFEKTTYAYNTLNQLVKMVNPSGETQHYQYDSQGRLQYAMREEGQVDGQTQVAVTAFQYDQNGQLVQQLEYEELAAIDKRQQLIISTLSDKKRLQGWIYDEAGRVALTIDAMGAVTAYRYDALGRNTSVKRYAQANTTLLDWFQQRLNANENADLSTARVIAAVGKNNTQDRVEHVFYDNNNQAVILIDAEGFITQQQFDGMGQLSATRRYNAQAGLQQVLQHTGKPLEELDTATVLSSLTALADATQDISDISFYDAVGRVVLTVDGEGYATYFEYDALSNLTLQRQIGLPIKLESVPATFNANWFASLQFYSQNTTEANAVTLISGAELQAYRDYRDTTFTYDANQRLSKTTSVAGDTNIQLYDALNRVSLSAENISEINATTQDDLITDRFVGQDGEIAWLIDRDGFIYRVNWNGDEVASLEKSSGFMASRALDGWREDYQAYFEEDDEDILVDVLGSISFEFGQVGVGSTITSASDIVRLIEGKIEVSQTILTQDRHQRYHYDDLGQLISIQSAQVKAANGQSVRYSEWANQYDQQGRLISTTDANRNTVYYFYDEAGRRSHQLTAVAAQVTDAQTGLVTQATRFEVLAWVFDSATGQLKEQHTWRSALTLNNVTGGDNTALLTQLERLKANNEASIDVLSFQYNQRGQLTHRVLGNQSIEWRYNAFGESIEKITESKDNEASTRYHRMQYDRRGLLIGESHAGESPIGKPVSESVKANQLKYDSFGRNITVIDGEGLARHIAYNKRGEQTRITSASGGTLTTHYNAYGEVIEKTDSAGLTLKYNYDTAKRQVTTLELLANGASQIKAQTTYNAVGEVVSVTDVFDNRTDYAYDLQGNLLEVVELNRNGLVFREQQASYDAMGNRLSLTTDERHSTWQYDEKNRVIQETRSRAGTEQASSEQSIISYRYDAADNVIETVGQTGIITRQILDERGNTLWLLTTDNATDRIYFDRLYYNADNQVIRTEKGELREPSLGASDDNKILLSLTTMSYDAAGQRLSEVQHDVNTNEQILAGSYYRYDRAGRLIAQSDAQGHQDHFFYNAKGEKAWQVDSEGRVSRATFNASGQIIQQISYAQAIAVDELASLTTEELAQRFANLAPADRVIHYQYNTKGLLTHEVDTLGSVTSFTYDDRDQVIRETHYAQQLSFTATTELSARQTRVTEQLANLPSHENDRTELTFYDDFGRLSYYVNASGKVTRYVYNKHDQIVLRREHASSLNPADIADLEDLKSKLQELPSGSDREEYYYYNVLGQRSLVIDATGAVTQYHYDAKNQELGSTRFATRFNGATTKTSVAVILEHVSEGESRSERIVRDALGRERFHLTLFQQNAQYRAEVIETRYGHASATLNNGENGLWQTMETFAYQSAIDWHEQDTIASITQKLAPLNYLSRQLTHLDAAGQVRETIDFDQPNEAAEQQHSRTVLRYDASGNLIERIKADGYRQHYVYNRDNQLIAQFDEVEKAQNTSLSTTGKGYWTTHRYNSFGEINETSRWMQAVSYDGQVPEAGERQRLRYAYDAEGRLLKQATYDENDQLASAQIHEFDVFDNIIEKYQLITLGTDSEHAQFEALTVEQAGTHWQKTVNTFDSSDRIVSTHQGSDSAINPQQGIYYRYNVWGEQTEIWHGSGQVIQSFYNRRGEKIREDRGWRAPEQDTGEAANQLQIMQRTETYRNTFGDITQLEQGNRAYAWDEDSQNYTVIYPVSSRQHFFYNHRGQIEIEVDAEGYVSQYQHDTNGVLLTATRWDNAITRPHSSTAPANFDRDIVQAQINAWQNDNSATAQVRRHEVDGLGRVTAVYVNASATGDAASTGPDAPQHQATHLIAQQSYDALGRITTRTDENGQTIHYQYNGLGHVIKEVVNLAAADAEGILTYQQIAVRDRDGHVVERQWQGLKQTEANTSAATALVSDGSATFNTQGQMTSQTDAFGMVTHYEYDARGLLLSKTNAASNSHHIFIYNARGQQLVSIDAAGHIQLRVYDDMGNPVATKTLAQSMGPSYPPTTQTLDALRATLKDFDTTATTRAGDPVSTLIAERHALLNNLSEVVASALGIQATDGREQYQVYDALNRLVITSTMPVATYTLQDGLQTEPNTVLSSNDSEENSQGALPLTTVTQYRAFAGGTLVEHIAEDGYAKREYLNGRGELVATLLMEKTDDPLATPNWRVTTYAYDARGNLIQETRHANAGKPMATDLLGLVTPNRDDRQTTWEYDTQDRLVREVKDKQLMRRDANGEQLPLSQRIIAERIITDYHYLGTSNRVSRQRTWEEHRATPQEAFTPQGEVQVMQWEYDTLGRITKTTRFEQNALSESKSAETWSSAHLATQFTWNRYNQLVNELQISTQRASTAYGNLSDEVIEHQRAQQNTYDRNRLQSSAGYQGHLTYTYDAAGRVNTVTDHIDGLVTQNSYDRANRVITTAYSELASGKKHYADAFVYNAYGEQTATLRYGTVANEGEQWQTKSRVLMSATEYDTAGRKVRITENGKTHWIAYNRRGQATMQLTQLTGASQAHLSLRSLLDREMDNEQWSLTLFEYREIDSDNQPLLTRQRQVQLNGSTIRQALDAVVQEFAAPTHQSNEVEETIASDAPANPAIWHDQHLAYNRFGELVRQTDPAGHVTEFEYNHAGWMTRQAKAATAQFETHYDYVNKIIETDNTGSTPERGVERYRYDAFGRVIEVIDENNKRITKAWDFDQTVLERKHFKTTVTRYNAFGDVSFQGRATGPSENASWIQAIHHAYNYQDDGGVTHHTWQQVMPVNGVKVTNQATTANNTQDTRFFNLFSTQKDAKGRQVARRAYRHQFDESLNTTMADWLSNNANVIQYETMAYDAMGQLSELKRYGTVPQSNDDTAAHFIQSTTRDYFIYNQHTAAEGDHAAGHQQAIARQSVDTLRFHAYDKQQENGETNTQRVATLSHETMLQNSSNQTLSSHKQNSQTELNHNETVTAEAMRAEQTSQPTKTLYTEDRISTYNQQGQLIELSDGNGVKLQSFEYDQLGRLTTLTRYVNGELAGASQEHYSYDANGQKTAEITIINVNKENESIRYKAAQYNARGWLTRIAMFDGERVTDGQGNEGFNIKPANTQALWQVDYGYDAKGNITRQVLTQFQPASEAQAAQTIITHNRFAFDAYDRIEAREVDGSLQRIIYDTLDRQIEIDSRDPGASESHAKVQHEYRADGKRVKTIVTQGSDEQQVKQKEYYIYDDDMPFDDNGQINIEGLGSLLEGLPSGNLQNNLKSADFTGRGQLLATLSVREASNNGTITRSLEQISINQFDANSGQMAGNLLFEYRDGSQNTVTSTNRFDSWGNLTQTVQTIASPDSDVQTQITTRYDYLDLTAAKKKKISLEGRLIYVGDESDENYADNVRFFDTAINNLWGGAESVFDYGSDNNNTQVLSVEKFQVNRDIDQKVFQDILYRTELTELEKNDLGDANAPDYAERYQKALDDKRNRLLQAAFQPVREATANNAYQYNANTQITQRYEENLGETPRTHTDYFYFDGRVLAEQVDDGALVLASPHVNNIGDSLLGNGSTQLYRVRKGDTLQSIAARYYGDGSLWYLIAEANGLGASPTLLTGQRLQVPQAIQSTNYNSNTQQTYNWGERLGNINPSLPDMPEVPEAPPPPPPPSQCEQIVSILVVAVIAISAAVAVAALTAVSGPVGAFAGAVVFGAVEGMVSQMSVQGVQMAFGSRELGQFDGAAIAEGAIMGAVAGAFSGGMASFGKVAAEASSLLKVAELTKTSANLSRFQRAAQSISTATSTMSRTRRFAGNLGFGLVMGSATDAAGQGFRMALDGQREFDWVRFGASALTSSASVGISGVRGEAGLLREGEILSKKVLGSATRRFSVNAGLHSGLSMTSSVVQHVAYGQSLDSMQWGVAAVQAMADGFTEATADRVTQKFDNLGAIDPNFYQTSSFRQRIAMLAQQLRGKGNAAQNAKLIEQRQEKIFKAFDEMPDEATKSVILQNLQQKMAHVKPLQLSRALDVLPSHIKSNRGSWLDSLTNPGSTSENAKRINAAKTTKEVDDALSPNCFAAGTLIHTQNGLVPIEQITQRHRILTRNENDPTGALVYRPILDHFVNPNKDVVAVTFANVQGQQETLISTLGHPYYVTGKAWVDAIDLQVGDTLLSAKGGLLTVEAVEPLAETTTVYNFEVPVDHTYFVGELGVWTHNQGCYIPRIVNYNKNTDNLALAIKHHDRLKDDLIKNYKTYLKSDNFTVTKIKGRRDSTDKGHTEGLIMKTVPNSAENRRKNPPVDGQRLLRKLNEERMTKKFNDEDDGKHKFFNSVLNKLPKVELSHFGRSNRFGGGGDSLNQAPATWGQNSERSAVENAMSFLLVDNKFEVRTKSTVIREKSTGALVGERLKIYVRVNNTKRKPTTAEKKENDFVVVYDDVLVGERPPIAAAEYSSIYNSIIDNATKLESVEPTIKRRDSKTKATRKGISSKNSGSQLIETDFTSYRTFRDNKKTTYTDREEALKQAQLDELEAINNSEEKDLLKFLSETLHKEFINSGTCKLTHDHYTKKKIYLPNEPRKRIDRIDNILNSVEPLTPKEGENVVARIHQNIAKLYDIRFELEDGEIEQQRLTETDKNINEIYSDLHELFKARERKNTRFFHF